MSGTIDEIVSSGWTKIVAGAFAFGLLWFTVKENNKDIESMRLDIIEIEKNKVSHTDFKVLERRQSKKIKIQNELKEELDDVQIQIVKLKCEK